MWGDSIYVFRLKENVSLAMGKNFLPAKGINNLNFRLKCD